MPKNILPKIAVTIERKQAEMVNTLDEGKSEFTALQNEPAECRVEGHFWPDMEEYWVCSKCWKLVPISETESDVQKE